MKTSQFLSIVDEESKLDWMTVMGILGLIRAILFCDCLSLLLFLMTLISYHYSGYIRQRHSQGHDAELAQVNTKMGELESKVSSLSIASAFTRGNQYG